MGRADDWARLCRVLESDPFVAERVRAAVEDGDDPWQALLDGLDEAGALAYLQLDDSGMELADALAQLPRVFRAQPDLGTVTDTDDLGEATVVADALLLRVGLRVARLVEDDDAWPVVVVDVEGAATAAALAAALGQRIVLGG